MSGTEVSSTSTSGSEVADAFLSDLDRMGIYVSPSGHRAVHKPLLVLLMLARVQRMHSARATFNDIEEPLERLIAEFGRTSEQKPRAHYPFWYLKSDGFWTVDSADELVQRQGKPEPKVSSLRELSVSAGFAEPIASRLLADQGLVREAATRVLKNAFPETRYVDVLDAVGLQLAIEVLSTRRDAAFRREILRAYNARCAVCGYAGRLGVQPVGIEAAHIKWVQFGGPNEITNGIALCSLHHKLFDVGAFTVRSRDLRLLVSPQFDGIDASTAALIKMAASDGTLAAPLRDQEHPNARFLEWHAAEVFISGSRSASASRTPSPL